MRTDKRAIDEALEDKGGRVLREWRMWGGGGGGEGSVGWKCGRKRRRGLGGIQEHPTGKHPVASLLICNCPCASPN